MTLEEFYALPQAALYTCGKAVPSIQFLGLRDACLAHLSDPRLPRHHCARPSHQVGPKEIVLDHELVVLSRSGRRHPERGYEL